MPADLPDLELAPLYVPGDRPDRFAKALAASPHVILDLEDAVAPARKDYARTAVAEALTSGHPFTVRVNAAGTPWHDADLAAVAPRPGLRAIRLPKVETPSDVFTAVARLQAAGAAETVTLACLLESAAGIEAAFEIARSHPRVRAISLGEADLRSDLGLPDPDIPAGPGPGIPTGPDPGTPADSGPGTPTGPGPGAAALAGSGPGDVAGLDPGLTWARSRVVVAARAAGLPPPLMSVHPHVSDLDGLAATCRAGRRLGFVGRTCIHPRQVPVVVRAFRPTEAELTRARELLAALAAAEPAGHGVLTLPDGRMIDPAMSGAARRTVRTAEAAASYLDR